MTSLALCGSRGHARRALAFWMSLMLAVSVGACGGASGSPGGGNGQQYCGNPTTVNGQPQVVVILMDGIGSQEEGGSFYPLPVAHPASGTPAVSNYCPVDPSGNERGWPTGLNQGLRRWSEFKVPGGGSGSSGGSIDGTQACTLSGGLKTDSCLVARLADTGAVLLPYSYVGAFLSSTSAGPLFTMIAYSSGDTKREPLDSVKALDGEITSIHQVWPATRIVIAGHSYSGLVAELWWENDRRKSSDGEGVTHVFSLDSPINGVEHCLLAAGPFGSIVGGLVSDEFCQLWNHQAIHDSAIINWDSDGSFTAIGTPNDPTYTSPVDNGNLVPQVIYSCAATSSNCVAQPPSFVSSSAQCDGKTGKLYGTTGHDLVKACPDVVKLIAGAVLSARDNGPQSGGNPGSGLPSGAPTVTIAKDIGSQPNPSVQWNISYPQLSGLADPAIQDAINAKLKQGPENLKAQFLASVAQYPPNGSGASTFDLSIAGSRVRSNFFSVGFSGYQNESGSAHGLNLDLGMNFDLSTGKTLTNRDLVNPGAGPNAQAANLQALTNAVYQLAQAQLAPVGSACTIDQSKLLGGPDDPSPLFFTDEGAMIGYPNYTFGINPCGFQPALIPYSKLTGVLNPTYFS